MGAYGAWNYLIQRPDLFKGIISVAGGVMLPIEQNLKLIKDKPILIYHGDRDGVVNVNESINVYNKLMSIGASNVELKIIKNDNHFLTSHAFKDKYIYEWLEKNIKGDK
jgi:predicted esterase